MFLGILGLSQKFIPLAFPVHRAPFGRQFEHFRTLSNNAAVALLMGREPDDGWVTEGTHL